LNRAGYVSRAAVLVATASALAGCSLAAPPPPPPPQITGITTGADLSPGAPVHLDAAHSRLTGVALTSADGKQVPGQVSPDGQHWTPSAPLEFGTNYTWAGTANGPGGHVPVQGSFRTVEPKEQTHAQINIGDGEQVGIAAPVIIQFNKHIQDRAAAERALRINTSVPTEGSWAWLPDTPEGSAVHWRPKDYWKPGTQVSVDAPLYGVPYGDGNFGKENLSTHFTIGRDQVVKGDAKSHQLVVERDGKPVDSFDASYGMASDPDRNTKSGIHVVSGKQEQVRMVSPQYHYDQVEHWAVRMSNNGEFIHANPATTGEQGSSNVTHGCVNLSTGDAKKYFDSALYGDPVEITGTGKQLSAQDGDIYDWTIPWDQWKSMSALGGAAPQPPAPATNLDAKQPPR
jgi:lipoprotein-anchoring transpeptidase ErfK/SrfK